MAVWMPMSLAAANSLAAKRVCASGSPPDSVNPPFITLRPLAYLPSSSTARPIGTGIPFLIVQVSGLWQNLQRNMHSAIHATRRMPGPSTAEPVVKECMKPMSPLVSAAWISFSGTSLALSTLSSNGLFASSEADPPVAAAMSTSVEGSGDDIHLLLARQPHEIDRIAGYADRQARILLRVIHRIHQRLAVQHVDVHVIAGGSEKRVQHRGEIGDALVAQAPEPDRHDRRRQRDAVGCIAIGNLGDRRRRGVDAVAVAAMHRIRTGRKRLTAPAPVGRVAGRLSVH